MRYEQLRTDRGTFELAVPNTRTEGDGFYVSYNSQDTATYSSDTTALIFGQMQRFFILSGDHRAQYAELVPNGFEACLDYYKANPDQAHERSDAVDDIPGYEPAARATPGP
ncbi:hypothetical protein BHAOGJBA_5178 [Methylobacterium hispanicum]|uniref:Uncharacterized protein n=1 Tax=Methylobacterium hispanicum TaxID=270350 RepID=A0AAV4ZUG1_9HYPH|nr:hypothetical protein [Methylobacterium hispanicum]GJD91630.1 hypothetical protein BHAOGJBA_5178 [Methylobacterium hispanicum]